MNTRYNVVTAVLITGILMVSQGATAAVTAVYWTDRDNATLSKTVISGGTTVLVPSGFNRLQDVDLDPSVNGKLYFSDWGPLGPPGGGGTINKVNTNGTGLANVHTGGDAIHQLALDIPNQRTYFTRAVSYDDREISRVDFTGANYTVLQSGTASNPWGWFQSGLALDAANSLLYWGDAGIATGNVPDGSMNRMAITGAGPTQLTPHTVGRGRAFALDAASQTIFLTAHDVQTPGANGAVFAYDIVNNIETQIVPTNPNSGYWDIEIDPFAQRIWWTAPGLGQILSSNFNGTGVQVEVSGLTNPYGLALEVVVPEPAGLSLLAVGALALCRRPHRSLLN